MKNHWSSGAGSDEGKLHPFVMDCLLAFHHKAVSQGITVLVITGNQDSGDMVPNKGASE